MAGKRGGKGDPASSIIIRRDEMVEGAHHGGAWKVAYADFVTAMMAFFLLMWLLNSTTPEQRQGLADYFSPSNAMAHTTSGFGAIFGGHTPNDDGWLSSDRGAVQVMNADAKPVFDVEDDDSDVPAESSSFRTSGESKTLTRSPQPDHPGGPVTKAAPHPGDQVQPASATGPVAPGPDLQAELAKRERAAFDDAAKQIRMAVAQDPALADLARQLSVDITPEGLRIQILDEEHQPMFPTGSAVLSDRARALLLKVVPVLMTLPEKLSFSGHTDAAPYHGGDRTNWDLSADRANATRRLFAEAGLPDSRVKSVSGQADRDLLLPADPLAAANRRIAILVLRDPAALQPGH
jgi:chemotaxis protein MotB